MNKKIICVIANGYAEEMMASTLVEELRLQMGDRAVDYFFVGGSLVSSGRWYQDKQIATFYSGGISPSGGFPTRSLGGFFSDLFAGIFKGPFRLARFVKSWTTYGLDMVIVVGDFLLLTTVIPALKKKNVKCIFIPTAKSNYIQPHFKIEKKYIKKYVDICFPRDEITAQDFRDAEINAEYLGNLMQDLLDSTVTPLVAEHPIVALLPGSRQESYGNLDKILTVVEHITLPIHWAFVQASVLNDTKIEHIFRKRKWIKEGDHCWINGFNKVYVYPGVDFDKVALGCIMGISLAGTVGDQIAGLGKPILSFVGTGPQSSKVRMEEYEKLLGDAFVYEKKFPMGVVNTLNRMLTNDQFRAKLGAEGLKRMGSSGGTQKIAQKLLTTFLR
ncbi:MAG: hypothetical protein ACRCV0_04790 [Brevinema sp.]